MLHNLSLPLLRSKCAKKSVLNLCQPPSPLPPPGFPRFVCMCGCGPQRKYVRWTRPAVKGWPGPSGPMTSNRAVLGNMPGTGGGEEFSALQCCFHRGLRKTILYNGSYLRLAHRWAQILQLIHKWLLLFTNTYQYSSLTLTVTLFNGRHVLESHE